MEDPDELIMPGEVSRLLGVDKRTVSRWANQGLLKAVILPSGHRRFRRSDVDRVLHPEAPDAA